MRLDEHCDEIAYALADIDALRVSRDLASMCIATYLKENNLLISELNESNITEATG